MDFNHYALARQLGNFLKARQWKLAVAESCTGGGLCRIITQISGCSEWFDRGAVTYTNQAKIEMLGVNRNVIATAGAVSSEVAKEMALGSINYSLAQVSLSITGIAGPTGGSIDKPVGTVWFGLAFRNGYVECRKALFDSGRYYIQDSAIDFSLRWLLQAIKIYPSHVTL